ncbi:TPA: transposase, partial [Staphylococcus delphini]|nr:transposase [Staphylococcus delphini]
YRDYKAHGIDVLLPNTKRKHYPKELKLNIINEYLHSDLSSYDLAIKYGIRSATQVKNWITMYTEGKEISDKSQYSEVYRMKSRKVTYEERVNIVQYYLNHDQSYSEVAHHFNISYGQIYAWVKKYQKHGMDGLIDGRGRGKPRSTMSEKEVKEAEIRALKEQ